MVIHSRKTLLTPLVTTLFVSSYTNAQESLRGIDPNGDIDFYSTEEEQNQNQQNEGHGGRLRQQFEFQDIDDDFRPSSSSWNSHLNKFDSHASSSGASGGGNVNEIEAITSDSADSLLEIGENQKRTQIKVQTLDPAVAVTLPSWFSSCKETYMDVGRKGGKDFVRLGCGISGINIIRIYSGGINIIIHFPNLFPILTPQSISTKKQIFTIHIHKKTKKGTNVGVQIRKLFQPYQYPSGQTYKSAPHYSEARQEVEKFKNVKLCTYCLCYCLCLCEKPLSQRR